MQQKSSLLSGISKTWLSNVWHSIEEMPINVWRKITETGNLCLLYKKEGEFDDKLSNVWLDCWQQYLDEFGIGEEVNRKMSVQKRLIRLNAKYVETRERDVLNWIEMAEKELEEMEKGTNVKFYDLLDVVSTKKGFRIDPNQITVIEWYYALENIKKNGNKGE